MKGGLKQTAGLALFLLSALFLNIFLFSVNACFAQEAAKFQVALLNVRDLTPAPSEATRYQAYDMLRLQIKQTPFFETKKEELVEMWLTKTKIVSSDEETAADMARGLNLDGVFIADIYEITVNEKIKEARIELQLQLIDKKGEVISRTYTYAGSFKKPGFAGETKLLVQEALQNAAASSLQETQKNLSTKGIVASIKGNGVVVTNLNLTHGIKKGAQLIVTRNGSKIARLVVIDVNKANSLSQITEMVNGKLISPSDNVQLIFNPLPDPKAEKAKLKTKSSKSAIRTLTSILVAGGVVALLASGKKDDNNSAAAAATGISISVAADPGNIVADKKTTAKITASLKDSATNVAIADGEAVTFKTTAGTLMAGTATTSGGTATVELQSDDKPGTASVTATYGSTSSATSVLFTSLSISISSNASSIAANGTSSATITATVKDANNAPAPDDTVVSFSTTDGTIGGSAATKNGAATTTLISKTSPSKVTATVTAKSGGAETTTTIEFIPVEPKVIFLSANLANVPANGTSSATLTAIVKDENSNLVPDGTEVKFTSNLGTVTDTAKTKDGQAQATITSTATGTATVIAQAGSVSTSTTVTFTSLSITLSASPTSIPADGVSTISLTIVSKSATTGSAQSNAQIKLTTSDGTFTSNGAKEVTKTTDGAGTIMETLKAGTTAGIITITASSSDTTTTTKVNFVSGGVSAISLSPSPSSIPADGKSTTTLSATVTDVYGNVIQDGTEIYFLSSDPNSKLSSSSTNPPTLAKATTSNGIATAILTSSLNANKVTLKACYNPSYNIINFPVLLPCSPDPLTLLQPITSETYVTFTFGTPAFITLGSTPLNVHGWDVINAEVKSTVLVYDSNHNFVSNGTVVNFTIDGGAIVSQATTTDGKIEISFYTIGSFPKGEAGTMGWATLTVTSGDAVGKNTILISGSPVSITASAASVGSSGDKYYKITANVWDVNNNPVVGGFTVKFTTNLGSFSKDNAEFEASSGTSGDGEIFQNVAEAKLYPRGNAGTASVTITSGAASTTIQFAISP